VKRLHATKVRRGQAPRRKPVYTYLYHYELRFNYDAIGPVSRLLAGERVPSGYRGLLDRELSDFMSIEEATARNFHLGSYRSPVLWVRTGRRIRTVANEMSL